MASPVLRLILCSWIKRLESDTFLRTIESPPILCRLTPRTLRGRCNSRWSWFSDVIQTEGHVENVRNLAIKREDLWHSHLTCLWNTAITIESNGTSLGVQFVWRKSEFKRVNPSKMRCDGSSARCNRKTSLRRSSVTPSTWSPARKSVLRKR